MSSSSSSSDDDSDGGMPAKRDVLGSDSESDDDGKLRVNESFAASFAKREKKRLDARGKALGADGSESDESSSESEDEDAVELTRGMDVKILETINAIRRKDPKIYDRDVEFFDAPAPRPQKAKQPKAQTYKDVARTQILAGGLDEDQAPEEAPPLAYDAEQRDLRKGLLAELNGDDDGDLFRVREAATVAPTDAAAEADEAKLRAELAAFSATETDADAFLADFVRQRRWAEAPSDDECDVDDAADLDQLDATDAFEAKYNFRFEQAGSSEIATHARDVVGSMRRKDDARRKKREERKERKAGERRRKEAELRRLKNLKKVELEAQIAKVAAESGGGALTAATLEDDFDPEAYDAQMAAAFGDDYYGDAEALEKPTWSDDDDAEDAEEEEEDDDEDEAPASSAAAALDESTVLAAVKQKARDALDAMDHEDLIGDLPTRFKYASVPKADYGLSVDEILETPDKELQQLVSIKRLAPYRDGEYAVSASKRKKWRKDQAEKKAARVAEYEAARKKQKRDKKKAKDRGAEDEAEAEAPRKRARTRKPKDGRTHRDGRALAKRGDGAKPDNAAGVSRARMAAYGFT